MVWQRFPSVSDIDFKGYPKHSLTYSKVETDETHTNLTADDDCQCLDNNTRSTNTDLNASTRSHYETETRNNFLAGTNRVPVVDKSNLSYHDTCDLEL